MTCHLQVAHGFLTALSGSQYKPPALRVVKDCIMIFIDCHVHFYHIFNLDIFLDSAWKNIKKYGEKYSKYKPYNMVLFLAKTQFTVEFNALLDENTNSDRWHIIKSRESETLIASHNNKCIFLIAGQQIVTKENLEILAIGTQENIKSGSKINATIDQIYEIGALPILPWGFGKWTGMRRKEIKKLVGNDHLFFGDISGHPFPNRSLLNSLKIEKDIECSLNGTDPLPMPQDQTRAGKFGVFVNEKLDSCQPWKSIRRYIIANQNKMSYFGKYEPLQTILNRQISLRLSPFFYPYS